MSDQKPNIVDDLQEIIAEQTRLTQANRALNEANRTLYEENIRLRDANNDLRLEIGEAKELLGSGGDGTLQGCVESTLEELQEKRDDNERLCVQLSALANEVLEWLDNKLIVLTDESVEKMKRFSGLTIGHDDTEDDEPVDLPLGNTVPVAVYRKRAKRINELLASVNKLSSENQELKVRAAATDYRVLKDHTPTTINEKATRELRAACSAMSSQNDNYKKEFTRLSDKNKELQRNLDGASTEIVSLTEELTDLQDMFEKLEEQNDHLKAQLEGLDTSSLVLRVKEQEEVIISKQKVIDDRSAQLDRVIKENDELEQKVKELSVTNEAISTLTKATHLIQVEPQGSVKPGQKLYFLVKDKKPVSATASEVQKITDLSPTVQGLTHEIATLKGLLKEALQWVSFQADKERHSDEYVYNRDRYSGARVKPEYFIAIHLETKIKELLKE